ncbi:glutathione S-transferase, partial [Conidiobolus coronatus NRRL 28638]
ISILKPRWFNLAVTPEQNTKNYDYLHRVLTYLESYTSGKTYLVGDRISLADINLMANLKMYFTQLMTGELRTKYPNITKYFEGLINVPQFVKVIGEIKYLD